MTNARATLVRTLIEAIALYEEKTAGSTLLGKLPPDDEVLSPVRQAIEACEAFAAAAGRAIYSGNSGIVLTSEILAGHLFARASDDAAEAVEWLFRLLTTRFAVGVFVAAIWGLEANEEIVLPDGARIIPFSQLPDSIMKTAILIRSKRHSGLKPWLSDNYYELPRAAFIKDVTDFPYISANGTAFEMIAQLEHDARNDWTVLEAAAVGSPLAFGSWFEYADRDLDLTTWQSPISWSLPEVNPYIKFFIQADSERVRNTFVSYADFPENGRQILLRSMNRFILSQCRNQMIDRILDLTLAFEIAVSGGGDAAPNWKISVRSAQMIGGDLATRQIKRSAVSKLGRLRNQATHGGTLKDSEKVEQERIIIESSAIYCELINSILAYGKKPKWDEIELEPILE